MTTRPKAVGTLSVVVAAWAVLGAGVLAPLEAQEVPSDRDRLQAVLVQLEDGDVPLEELMSIPAARQSQELGRSIEELVRTRSEVQELRSRYIDEYPPIQTRLATIASIETEAVPEIVRGLLAGLPGSDGD